MSTNGAAMESNKGKRSTNESVGTVIIKIDLQLQFYLITIYSEMSTSVTRRPLVSTSVQSQRPPANLAEVIATVAEQPQLGDRERKELACACRTVARVLGLEPAAIDADPSSLRLRLKALPKAPDGLSPGYWRNTLSRLGKALHLAGSVSARRRSKTVVSASWKPLIAAVPDRYLRCRLMKLARHCSAEGIEPDSVTDAVVAEFGAVLHRSLAERPKQSHREVCLAWNRAAELVPGWPACKLVVPSHAKPVSAPLAAYPASFQADVAAFLALYAGDDLFAEAARKPASPVTLHSRRLQIRQLASALVAAGRSPDTITGLADLVRPETAKTILEHCWQRNGKRKTGQLQNYALLLVILAKHWVKSPAADIVALQSLLKKLAVPNTGMTPRNRSRLRAFDDEANVRKLLEAPWAIERTIPRNGEPTYRQAVAMQSAVGISLVLAAPIRAKNLASLHVGRHLVRTRLGTDGMTHLVIPPGEVKNSQPLEFALPARVAKLVDLYVSRYLPVLTSNPNGPHFPGRDGNAKTPAELSAQLKRAVRLATGLDVNLHLFRHIAAKLFLAKFPGEYQTVAQLLGHKDMATTVRAYCEMKQSDAVRRYDTMLQERVSQGASP
jgi:integrase